MKLYKKDRRQVEKELLCGEGIYRKRRGLIDNSCSIGFFAKHANNPDITYAVTTGHCYTNSGSNIFYYFPWGDRPDDTLLGLMVTHRVKDYDYGLIELKRRGIRPLPMIRNTGANEYKQLQIRDIKPVSNHGAHLCKSAHTTHATCGYVKAFDGIFINSESFETEMIITDIVGDHGDSGGTAYYYYENLLSVNLSGIYTGGNKGIGSVLPLQIILDETEIVPMLVNG
ncbi:serine protease [Gigaspora margarita]|uniref:Serine protease n=1 Tax=Gigaspora margarita TaxID=4874 RepID=A0A8H4A814_GIGMA|nr:serine protease [Gigaspora margarita]